MNNKKYLSFDEELKAEALTKFKPCTGVRSFFKKFGKVLGVIAVSLLAVFLVTVCIVSSAAIIYVHNYETKEVIKLEDYTQYTGNSIVYAYNGDGEVVVMQELQGGENRNWTFINDIPKSMQDAVIAIEDERFYSHNGVDWKRTAGAFANMFTSVYSTQQGGSTITQQLIKLLTGNDDTTIERKFNEILEALEFEKNYSKTEILEAYLNEIYVANNCYGVQAGARFYFGKDVGELNLAECATLAVITNAPSYYDPIANPENNKERRDYCLQKMLELQMISESEYEEAINYELVFRGSGSGDTDTADNSEYFNYYTDFVIETVIKDLMDEYGYSEAKAKQLTMGGGLHIYSCANLDIQNKVQYIYENKTAGFNDDELQSAMVIMEYDGRVVGMVGGAGKKDGSRSYNRAVHATRSPGSSMKPLAVYSYGIENNLITWSSLYLDKALVVNGKSYPNNTDGTYGTGKMLTVQYAICHSTNTIAARLAQEFSVKACFNFVQETYHLTTFKPSDEVLSAVALGGMTNGVTVLEMAAAYQTFGNGGVYNPPYCYDKVLDSEGNVVLQHTPNPQTAIGADTAWVMNKLMQTVTAPGMGGTGQRFGLSQYGIETFGKSGSTNNYCDVWFCGGSPYYVAATWTGYDYSKPINVWAGNTSGIIWNAVMKSIHEDLPEAKFQESASVQELSYCTVSGNIASPYCMSTAKGWYKVSYTGDVCTTCGYGN